MSLAKQVYTQERTPSGDEDRPGGKHSLVLTNRRRAEFEGVRDVRAFDETEVMLETELGMLMVRGRDLQVKKLSLETGELSVEGEIDGLVYSAKIGRKKSGESALKRLFG